MKPIGRINPNHQKDIDDRVCSTFWGCGKSVDVEGFRDEISLKEFHISGLCQSCQDKVFAELEEEYDDEDESTF